MKPLLLLLGLSLAANAALYFFRPSPDGLNTAANPAVRSASSTSPAASAASSPSSAKTPAAPANPYTAFWEKLRAGDASLVASLRAAGWPEDAIRALVIAQINDQFRPRQLALRPDLSKIEYWKQNAFSARYTPESMKASRDLAREKKALLKTLLGTSYNPNEFDDYIVRRYDGLPITADQSESMEMIEEDYRILTTEVRGNNATFGSSILLAEDREKLAFLEKEKAADLAKILSPELLLDWELRNSTVASSLRSQLTAFAPTEQEFRQLYAIQKTANDNAGYFAGAPQGAYTKAQSETDAEIKKLLSPERYADYTRAKDYEYRQLYQLTQRLQLPKETAVAAHSLKADFEKRSREIPNAPGPDAKKTAADARAALVTEAEQQLTQLLGQRGYDAYKSSGSSWISRLSTPLPSRP